MGRGDKKSKRGKRSKGSFGVARNRAAIRARLKRSTARRSADAEAAASAPKTPRKAAPRKKSEG